MSFKELLKLEEVEDTLEGSTVIILSDSEEFFNEVKTYVETKNHKIIISPFCVTNVLKRSANVSLDGLFHWLERLHTGKAISNPSHYFIYFDDLENYKYIFNERFPLYVSQQDSLEDIRILIPYYLFLKLTPYFEKHFIKLTTSPIFQSNFLLLARGIVKRNYK